MASGALSRIYRGQDTVLQRPIVVKAVPPRHTEAYQRALQVTGGLTHPAVVATYDALMHEDGLFLVQEAVSAKPLDIYLGAGIPSERSLDLALQLARVLAYAHTHGVVHGDLTPVAVLVDRRAQVHLNNFSLPPDTEYLNGVIQALPADDEGGDVDGMGTVVTFTDAPASPDSDVRAIGLLLFQMLRTSTTSPGDTGDFAKVGAFRVDVPGPVQDLVWRCLRPYHPRPIRDAESLTLALELEAQALAGARTPQSELTPPALRAARGALAQAASWSTADTQGSARPWRYAGRAESARVGGSNHTPGTSTTEWQGAPTRVATEEPPGLPKLRLPSRSDPAPEAYNQPDAAEWLEHDVTQPQSKARVTSPAKAISLLSTPGMGVVVVLCAALFLLAFLLGFFVVAAR